MAKDCVILLHGLARTSNSFLLMEWRLKREGYTVVNASYPSTQATVEELSSRAVAPALRACGTRQTHFVTHSMGAIVLRHYVATHGVPRNLGRTVMLGPPNKGTPIVDQMEEIPGFAYFNGPAGAQLGTGPDSLPNRLGPVNFAVGVIAGYQSISPFMSAMMEGPNDGKVPVAATAVAGMKDHISLPVTHTFMMNNNKVQDQVINFLRDGKFSKEK
ncbi:MAG: alpha/beta fold hydrolase [Pseudomonadota bacterium]